MIDLDKKREQARLRQARYFLRHPERVLAKAKRYRAANLETVLIKQAQYRESNRDVLNAKQRGNYATKKKPWRLKNIDAQRAKQRAYDNKVRATVRGNLDYRMRSRLYHSLRGRESVSLTKLLGYTMSDLQRHIERLFKPGMNWERLLKGEIQIDHVIPVAKFAYESSDDPEFRRCWALENLQPLWATDNRKKSDRIDTPTQIALGV